MTTRFAVLLTACGCATAAVASGVATTARQADAAADPVARETGVGGCEFGNVENLGPGVNTPFFEGSPTVSSDGLALFFTSERHDGRQDIFVSARPHADSSWGDAVRLGSPVNHDAAHDFALRLSHDGLSLYFSSERPGGAGSSDLYVARRRSPEHEWEPPRNLGRPLNTEAFEAFPTPSADGNTLYFNRSTTWDSPDAAIWVATRAHEHEPWAEPARLAEPINGVGSNFAPAVSADGLTLYFASDRPGSIGRVDLWVARRERTNAPWQPPENLGVEVNAPGSVTLAPFLSSDGRRLYFMSSRPGGLGGPDCEFWNCFDLYVATRTCAAGR